MSKHVDWLREEVALVYGTEGFDKWMDKAQAAADYIERLEAFVIAHDEWASKRWEDDCTDEEIDACIKKYKAARAALEDQ